MPTLRLQRVRELLKREIGEIVRRVVPVGEAGLITVNEVKISPDLQNATVYVGVLGNAEHQARGFGELLQHRKQIQGLVGRAVVLKYTPQLRFVLDQSADQGNRVLKIIEELEKSGPPDETAPENN